MINRRMWGRVGVLAVVTLLGALSAGCAWFRSQPDVPLLHATAEQLVELLQQRDEAMQTMKALFRAQVKGPGIPLTQRIEGVLFYRRPDVVRLKGFNQLGGQLFDFRLQRDLYALRLAPTGQVYAGRTAELDRMGKIGRPFRLTLWAVTGTAAVEPVQPGERVRLYAEDMRYRLVVLAPALADGLRAVRQVWFDRRNLQVVQEDLLGTDGEIEATTRFSDFRAVGPTTQEGTPGARPDEVAAVRGQGAGAARARETEVFVRPFKVTTDDGRGGGTLQLLFHEIIPNPILQPEDLAPGAPESRPRENRGG